VGRLSSSSIEPQFERSADERPAEERRFPLWLYPQVLSLDAPAIAVAWQWLFAKTFHVTIGASILFVTGACVWMIYAADHLLDVRSGATYSARHRFMARHSRWFVASAIWVFASAAVAAWRFPLAIWVGALELTAAVGIYLGFVHLLGDRVRHHWPKEFVIGAVFAAGSTIATWTSARGAWPAILLFAGLCTLNCCAVDYWEWQGNGVLLRYPHTMTRWVARHFMWCAVGLLAAAVVVFALVGTMIPIAVSASVLLLMLVNGRRRWLSPEAIRLLADAALLTPLLFLPR
jgi:hypothetical protein